MGVGDDVGKVSAGFHWGGRREGEEDGGHKRKKRKRKKEGNLNTKYAIDSECMKNI